MATSDPTSANCIRRTDPPACTEIMRGDVAVEYARERLCVAVCKQNSFDVASILLHERIKLGRVPYCSMRVALARVGTRARGFRRCNPALEMRTASRNREGWLPS